MLKRVILTYDENPYDGIKGEMIETAIKVAGGPRRVRTQKKALE